MSNLKEFMKTHDIHSYRTDYEAVNAYIEWLFKKKGNK